MLTPSSRSSTNSFELSNGSSSVLFASGAVKARAAFNHSAFNRGGKDTPQSDAFEEPARRQFGQTHRRGRSPRGVEERFEWSRDGGATRAADPSPEMRLTGLRAASRSGVSAAPP